jgi:hypothetical protein
VELTRLDTGGVRRVPCDLVVFTADWIPDHELAVLGGASLDPGTRGPSVDPALRTTRPGIFAAGNLLHGAETADVAALSGRGVVAGVLGHLEGEPWPEARVEIRCEPPLRWIAPNALTASTPAPRRFLLRAEEPLPATGVELLQAERRLWSGRLCHLGPGRSARLPSSWASGADAAGEPVVARLAP